MIDPSTDPYILEGRLVTMSPLGVVPDGHIFVRQGEIKAVQPARSPRPEGFADALLVRTGDTIYPGLIELHNHLSYNAMPLWNVPRKFSNNGQWRVGDDYRRRITKPSQVLGQTDGVLQALVRYVECRALLGGVTTSQGISLAGAGGIVRYYRGNVRNVEQSDATLPAAETNVANPDTNGAASYLLKLQRNTCYLQHLSEGIDETARGWFLRLRLDSGDWAVTDTLCAIHATALRREDFDVLANRGASMVWSPLSNYLLYGATVDLKAVKQAGMLMGLGSDWAPSGSKNLLGELKVAHLASQEQGDVFAPEEIVAMATINPARIAKWDPHLGSIEPGKRADLLVINGQSGDPYKHLIEARETSVTLVVIDGVPRAGQRGLMGRFGPGTEEIKVGQSQRVLNLQEPDDLLAGITLTDAIGVLEDAMARLPELAANIDETETKGLFSGALGDTGTSWRVMSDFEEGDRRLERALSLATGINLAAMPYSSWVDPMTLDPPTVADDLNHLRSLVAARNLPDFVKRGLPPLYGERIPLPDSARFLTTPEEPVTPEVLATTGELADLLLSFVSSGGRSPAQRKDARTGFQCE
jgi:5-methylthioadenosine/S-adenosylhomocysteine deaminase